MRDFFFHIIVFGILLVFFYIQEMLLRQGKTIENDTQNIRII